MIEEEKKCSKCGKVGALSDFPKDKRKKNGVSNPCLLCVRKRSEEYRNNNKEKMAYMRLRYVEKNIEKERERQREKSRKARKENYKKTKESTIKWREKNKDKVIEMSRRASNKRRELHKDRVNESNRKFNKKSREILSNKYVSDLISQHTKIKTKDIPIELIYLKRAQIFLIREIKRIDNEKRKQTS